MPQFTESESPWSQLAAALQETTALKEHATVTGLATDTSAPQRIVLSPLRGPFKPRAKRPAIIDVDLQVEARIWAESEAHAWDLLVRLVRAVAEYGVSGGPLVEWDEVDFDAPDDTSGQGAPCSRIARASRKPNSRQAAMAPTGCHLPKIIAASAM